MTLWLALLAAGRADDTEKSTDLKPLYALAGDGAFQSYANNPVLSPGVKGAWDAGAIGTSTVVKANGVYHLYYEAWASLTPHHSDKDYATLQIGHATSPDGIHWTKDSANPVIPHGVDKEWDRGGTWDPFVLYENGVFKMWYGGGGGGISVCDWGYAESKDGVHFTKKGQISHLGQEEDDRVAHDPKTGRYYMYYWDRNHTHDGLGVGLYCASSSNETDFDFAHAVPIKIEGLPYPTPGHGENQPGFPGFYKYTQVFQDDGKWYMVYGRWMGWAKKNDLTGLAASDDFIHWKLLKPDLLEGHDSALLKVSDDLWLMYYGPNGQYDMPACDVRLAVFKGHLSDLAAKPK
jgi:predicted GH43/DUF377 family glycosyl hydrolase